MKTLLGVFLILAIPGIWLMYRFVSKIADDCWDLEEDIVDKGE